MAEENENKKNEKADLYYFNRRWRPDFRYVDDKFAEIGLKTFKSTEPSVTDKEAYRLTLASLRGELAQGSGRIDVGSYSLKAGEEYDPSKDFSFLNRKDLTIVELDDYMKVMQRKLEESDSALEAQIKEELAQAEKKKQELVNDNKNKNDQVKE